MSSGLVQVNFSSAEAYSLVEGQYSLAEILCSLGKIACFSVDIVCSLGEMACCVM